MFTEAQDCYHRYKQNKSECKGRQIKSLSLKSLNVIGNFANGAIYDSFIGL